MDNQKECYKCHNKLASDACKVQNCVELREDKIRKMEKNRD